MDYSNVSQEEEKVYLFLPEKRENLSVCGFPRRPDRTSGSGNRAESFFYIEFQHKVFFFLLDKQALRQYC